MLDVSSLSSLQVREALDFLNQRPPTIEVMMMRLVRIPVSLALDFFTVDTASGPIITHIPGQNETVFGA